jgi:hypothetical protein
MVLPTQLIRFSPRFQRAVHLRYDLRSVEAIDRYIPTVSAVQAAESILRGTQHEATQRAHVLHAAYGSGKSLFAVCLAALLENRDDLYRVNERLIDRIKQTDPNIGQVAQQFIADGSRFLPVILSGNEGDFASAITRALTRSLGDAGLTNIQPGTRFESALYTLQKWQDYYPDALRAFEHILLEEKRISLSYLSEKLNIHDVTAFEVFAELYPRVTAGAAFDQFAEQSPELIFRDVAGVINEYGFNGIVVLWDEFGRYLEGRTTQAFGGEAALLQNFAETCNYSGQAQIHLLLFTHKELQSYASNLPKAYQQEWSRIEGRFQRHNVSSDPLVAYRLVSSAIEQPDFRAVEELLSSSNVDELVTASHDFHLFPVFELTQIRQFVYSTFPLHPLTVFSLVRLSNKVAQNERTMFTFLTADEPNSLQNIIQHQSEEEEVFFVRPHSLWDYFEDAIRADIGIGGAHRFWSGVAHALDKIAEDDVLSQAVVKTLGVLLIAADQTAVRPTTELLVWATGTDETRTVLENLRRRKAIINRKVDGYWTFTSGSDLDFEQKLAEVLERTNPTPLQLRRLLENLVSPPNILARRYNQERAITRYFTGLYRWTYELEDAPWDIQIQHLDNADGLVVYVLAHDDLSLAEISRLIREHPRVVYVQPDRPLSHLMDALRELFALYELNNDSTLKQHDDRNRIQRELNWMIEDAQTRLEREISALNDPRLGRSIWITVQDGTAHCYQVADTSYPTRIVSDICEQIFPATPIFNSEGLNKQKPTTQQVRAAQKLIDALFTQDPSPTLSLEGYGPEVLALNSLLVIPGILREAEDGQWVVGYPDNNDLLSEIWSEIDGYLINTREMGAQPIRPLLDRLTAPPYGIRQGVLPVLLAAVLREHLRVTTIRRDKRALFPITGDLITDIITHPDVYTIEIGQWSEKREHLWRAILSRFGSHIHQSEHQFQPLTLLPLALIRWLQSQSQFCRQTQKLAADALQFRDLIRVAQTEPAQVLFEKLPELLQIKENTSQENIEARLDSLTTAISNAYLDLQRRLDTYTTQEFNQIGQDGATALQSWLNNIQNKRGSELRDLRFGSLVTQELVSTLGNTENANGHFWDHLSKAIMGIHLRDWSDQSEARFYETLANARHEVEREVQQLIADEEVVSVTVQATSSNKHDFRFRSADLTSQGKRLLQNFKSTLEIAGRSLSADEKRQIAVAFLLHVMGEDLGD